MTELLTGAAAARIAERSLTTESMAHKAIHDVHASDLSSPNHAL